MSTEQIRIETIREIGASLHSAIEGLPLANAKRLAAELWDCTARVQAECDGAAPDSVLRGELVDAIRYDLPTISTAAADALAQPLARKLAKAMQGIKPPAPPAPGRARTEKSADADLPEEQRKSSWGHADE